MVEGTGGSTVHKEEVQVTLDHPTGNPAIEPPLQFGHAFKEEHRHRLSNLSARVRERTTQETTAPAPSKQAGGVADRQRDIDQSPRMVQTTRK